MPIAKVHFCSWVIHLGVLREDLESFVLNVDPRLAIELLVSNSSAFSLSWCFVVPGPRDYSDPPRRFHARMRGCTLGLELVSSYHEFYFYLSVLCFIVYYDRKDIWTIAL